MSKRVQKGIDLTSMHREVEDLLPIYGRAGLSQVEDFPLDLSVGYQVRSTHRALQRHLHSLIEPHGVTLGMWYFLRALWHEDGVTQSDLSRLIGTMEPTTLSAISSMEKNGLVRRVRDKVDRRRLLIYLTPKGRSLKQKLLPLAVKAVQSATEGLPLWEVAMLLHVLKKVQGNLEAKLEQTEAPDLEAL
jgi:MarR family transcriptional regulator, organic hydroperoxide resistance regulator